jgi:hypothetical protein
VHLKDLDITPLQANLSDDYTSTHGVAMFLDAILEDVSQQAERL